MAKSAIELKRDVTKGEAGEVRRGGKLIRRTFPIQESKLSKGALAIVRDVVGNLQPTTSHLRPWPEVRGGR